MYHARHFILNHPYLKVQQFLTLYPYQYKMLNPLRTSRKQLRNFCYQQSAAARHILIFTDTTFSHSTQVFLFQPGFFFSSMFPLVFVVSIFYSYGSDLLLIFFFSFFLLWNPRSLALAIKNG